jgi:nucleotide-binding universal stress UspA family protein
MKQNEQALIKYNKIVLIPTDFSEVCDNAVNHGVELAQFLKYNVCILHVLNKESLAFLKKEKLGMEYIDDKLKAYKEKYKDKTKVKIETRTAVGTIFEAINQVATDIKANLMLLGTHGKKGLQHLFGSYALKVVLDSPCPVVVVQKRSFGDGYNNIVFPVNNVLEIRQKVQWALLMAKLFSSKIHLFQSYESDAAMSSRLKIITSQITKIFDENKVPYVITTAAKSADYAEQLMSYAVTNKSDMIMIMTMPNEDVPGFNFSTWDEKLMFNDAEVPVMCINPIELGKYFYEWMGV